MAPLSLTGARTVLVMGFTVLLFNSGARFSLGLMLHPMEVDLGWSRTTLSAVVTVFMLIAAAALPFTGQLVDRWGARRVLLCGMALSGLSVMAMGWVTQPWHAYLCYGLLFALGSAATSITPIGVLLNRWYPDRLGMANSIAISGMGVGQLLIIAVLSSQLINLGWRLSFVWLGVVMIVLVLPFIVLSTQQQPPGQVLRASVTPSKVTEPPSLFVAIKQKPLWLVLVIYAICGFQDFLIATHIVALALDKGVSTPIAGNMLALMGLAGLVGVLLAGVINDRTGPIWPTAVCFVIRVGLFALLLLSHHPVAIISAGLGFGFTFWVTAPLTVVFTKALCGVALLGAVSGLITMVHHAFGGLGALYAASVFDLTGSYHHALTTMLVLSILGVALCMLLRRSQIKL